MFRTLRHSAANDTDEYVRRHCTEALDDINATMRSALLPSGAMTKTIHVLRPPPS